MNSRAWKKLKPSAVGLQQGSAFGHKSSQFHVLDRVGRNEEPRIHAPNCHFDSAPMKTTRPGPQPHRSTAASQKELRFHRPLRLPEGPQCLPSASRPGWRTPRASRTGLGLPKGASWGKTTDTLASINLWKYPKYRLTQRPISYIMLT